MDVNSFIGSRGISKPFRWRLPDSLADGVTYFWQVTTTGADGNTTTSHVWGFDFGGRVRYNLAPGWNLLSLPFKLDAYSEKLMQGLGVYGQSNGAYANKSSLEAGEGYCMLR